MAILLQISVSICSGDKNVSFSVELTALHICAFFSQNGFLSFRFSLESVHKVIQLANVDIHKQNLQFCELTKKLNSFTR